MRKLDRDRERIIHPSTLDNLVQKYKLPITPCLTRLKQKFQDENYPDYTNYEDVIRFADLVLMMIIVLYLLQVPWAEKTGGRHREDARSANS